eukprot:scaffold1272_cov250-Pinguiococcus_pyrenoidosus.AAC.39
MGDGAVIWDSVQASYTNFVATSYSIKVSIVGLLIHERALDAAVKRPGHFGEDAVTPLVLVRRAQPVVPVLRWPLDDQLIIQSPREQPAQAWKERGPVQRGWIPADISEAVVVPSTQQHNRVVMIKSRDAVAKVLVEVRRERQVLLLEERRGAPRPHAESAPPPKPSPTTMMIPGAVG